MKYHHVDVFSSKPFSGNSLTVFPKANLSLGAHQLALITREMRHFESIFLSCNTRRDYSARVFDLFGELEFAGHPVMGAACVLHELHGEAEEERWAIHLPAKKVEVKTSRNDGHYYAELNQGRPEFLKSVQRDEDINKFLAAVNLAPGDWHSEFPLQVVSTGLGYLIVPVRQNIERARIVASEFDKLLASVGARFVYVLQIGEYLEGRTWNNDGILEDVATGSAAGCVAAYLVRNGRNRLNETLVLNQGRFLGRPSRMRIRVEGSNSPERVIVGGEVAFVGQGELKTLPEAETG